AGHIDEKELVDILFQAHATVKQQVAWQQEIVKEVGIAKEPIKNDVDWELWTKRSDEYLTQARLKGIFIADKDVRNVAIAALLDAFLQQHQEDITQKVLPTNQIEYIFKEEMKLRLTDIFFTEGHRIDGRKFDQVRSVSTQVGLLPFTHGSALFARGQTQALATVTLGGGQDEQKIESLMSETIDERFMLHYNFPPFSVGEARMLRGPGRREIGHGYLARSAIVPVLPHKDAFPYTIRIVVDILESNGSSSMATVCGSTMALMNAGVPISSMVSGVAMGLLRSPDGKFQALTDISGFEDAFGLMDFKVAGTDQGITAIQMDIKYKNGLPKEVFEHALTQAKAGRAYILDQMRKVMTKPEEKLSDLVPQVTIVKIKQDKIGAIIGSGGKTIKEIIEQTKTSIDIEPDGTVKIYAGPDAEKEWAISWVKTLAGQIDKGARFHGVVRRVADFGLLVELVPGVMGLLHISNIPRDLQRNLEQNYVIGQGLDVEVVNYDPESDRIRLNFVQN
ncbi:MAG: polyribonucleotide nucleotidyltransferase, partial [Candidatus Babeliales bacterium]